MRVIVIGDIHGRRNWKELIDANALNVFVGDYFDPYDDYTFKQQADNFKELVSLKASQPNNFVLLYGNHDVHYFMKGERSSRYNDAHAQETKDLFESSKMLFHGIAFAPDNGHLISHAGVTKQWAYFRLGYKDGTPVPTPKELEVMVNDLWNTDKGAFSFMNNVQDWYDCYGTSSSHSPIWVRDETLAYNAINNGGGWLQIVGHTQHQKVERWQDCVFVDCLGFSTDAYVFETECLTENTDSDGKDNK